MTATVLRPPAGAAPVHRPGFLRRHPRVMLAVAVVVCLLAGGVYVLLGTPFAAVRRVQVSGTRTVPPGAVIAAARVPLGTPLVRLDSASVRARVLAGVANVGSVSVQRAWPSTVRLVVAERVVAVAVAQGGRFLLVDRTGVAYQLVDAAPAGVVTAALTRPGPTDPATRATLKVLAGLPADLRSRVQRITAPTPDQVTLVLADRREVLWGGADDGQAKAAVVAILLKRAGKHIDVSAPGLVTVR